MADGYALIEFNIDGEGRVKELNYLDKRLEILDLGMDDAYSMMEGQFSEDMKDVLVMAFFTYQSVSIGSGDYWSEEYEDVFNLESHFILKKDYKEFYRQMVTEELNSDINGFGNIHQLLQEDQKTYYEQLVVYWEELYDEDFVPVHSEHEMNIVTPFKK